MTFQHIGFMANSTPFSGTEYSIIVGIQVILVLVHFMAFLQLSTILYFEKFC